MLVKGGPDHQQIKHWLNSVTVLPRISGYQWFNIIFVNQRMYFKMADMVSWIHVAFPELKHDGRNTDHELNEGKC